MAVTRSYFIPGFGYINEVKGKAHFIPGWGYVNETVIPFSVSAALTEAGDTFASVVVQTILLTATINEIGDTFSASVTTTTVAASGPVFHHRRRGQPGVIMRGTGGAQGGTVP